MRDTWKSAKVGLLVLAALVASYAIFRLVEERTSGGGGYTVYAIFDDAQGLVPKSRVLVAGIQVGYIDRIRLWGARARVDIHMNDDVKLHKDANVSKKSASILGESLLVIYPGSVQHEKVKDGDRIEVAGGTASTSDILNSVQAIAASVRKVAEQLEHSFGTDEAGRQMSSALRNLTEALEGVNRTIQTNEATVTRTLENVERITTNSAPQLEKILANVERVTSQVRDAVASPEGGDAGVVGDTIASVNRASHELEGVLTDLRQVTDRTAKGKGTVGRLTSDEKLIDEVQGVAEGVGDIVGGISRLQTIVGLRSEYNFLANTFKSYVELRLQPREDRYFLIQLIDDPRGRTEFSQTTVRTSPPPADTPSFYQETRAVTKDAFRFSLQFAKRIHFATFRFGILESSGGVGVDFHLFDDRLELNNDVFAIGEQAYPRFRARLAYEVVQRFWILGGIDDALNKTSDFFFGAQLRFNDEDLKSILPFAGVGSATR